MQLHMTAPMDIGVEQSGPAGEGAVFNLKTADQAGEPSLTAQGRMADVETESESQSQRRAKKSSLTKKRTGSTGSSTPCTSNINPEGRQRRQSTSEESTQAEGDR